MSTALWTWAVDTPYGHNLYTLTLVPYGMTVDDVKRVQNLIMKHLGVMGSAPHTNRLYVKLAARDRPLFAEALSGLVESHRVMRDGNAVWLPGGERPVVRSRITSVPRPFATRPDSGDRERIVYDDWIYAVETGTRKGMYDYLHSIQWQPTELTP